MALGITVNDRSVYGNKKIVIASLAFDSSYPTNGESFTPADVSLDTISFISFEQRAGYLFEYDYTNKKIKVYGPHTHTIRFQTSAAANAVTAAADQLRTAAAAFSVTGVADATGEGGVVKAVLAEVANTTDLSSAITALRVQVFGN